MGNKSAKYLEYTPDDAREGKIHLKHACKMLADSKLGRPDTTEEIYNFLKKNWDKNEYMYEWVSAALSSYELSREQLFTQNKIYTPRG